MQTRVNSSVHAGPRGPRSADEVSGQLPRHACRHLARRYVVRLSGGRWRRTQHAGGPTRPELGACPAQPRRRTRAACTPISPTRMHEFLDNWCKFFYLIMGILSYCTVHHVYVQIALTEVHSRS